MVSVHLQLTVLTPVSKATQAVAAPINVEESLKASELKTKFNRKATRHFNWLPRIYTEANMLTPRHWKSIWLVSFYS